MLKVKLCRMSLDLSQIVKCVGVETPHCEDVEM